MCTFSPSRNRQPHWQLETAAISPPLRTLFCQENVDLYSTAGRPTRTAFRLCSPYRCESKSSLLQKADQVVVQLPVSLTSLSRIDFADLWRNACMIDAHREPSIRTALNAFAFDVASLLPTPSVAQSPPFETLQSAQNQCCQALLSHLRTARCQFCVF